MCNRINADHDDLCISVQMPRQRLSEILLRRTKLEMQTIDHDLT